MESLLGITFKDWWRVLNENHFRIHAVYAKRAAFLTLKSIFNSIHRRKEIRLYGEAIENVRITEDPIFILGHWRSGTTLLHNLFSLDPQFAYPNNFQVTSPHTFLFAEEIVKKQLEKMSPHKRPMDNVEVTYKSPAEDEFGIAMLSLRSPMVAWCFPLREKYYDRFLTFRRASQKEIDAWKSATLFFLKKLTLRYNRRLVLKSPTHTARIRLLLEMFPNALFIHIHRDPFTVFQSTRKLYDKTVSLSYLQKPRWDEIDAGILRRYKEMYDAFFEERSLIPAKQFLEISFEDFEKNQYDYLKNIYAYFHLPGFDKISTPCR